MPGTPSSSAMATTWRSANTTWRDHGALHATDDEACEPRKDTTMTRDQALALAAAIEATLAHDPGPSAARVAVYRETRERYVVHVYTRPRTLVLHRACHWRRRN